MAGWVRWLTGLTLLLMAAAPARAEWLRAESPNFILFGEGSEARLRERAQMLEDFDRLLRHVTSTSTPPAANKLRIYLLPSARDLRQVRNVPPRTAGLYTGDDEGIAAFVDASGGSSVNLFLFHEYAHHFMRQYAPSAYPSWYVEGFAEYFMTARVQRDRIDIGDVWAGRSYALTGGEWLPVERVLFGTSEGLSPQQRSSFYAQSWLITHYFFSSPERAEALNRYLTLARSGDPRQALQTATGMTVVAFQREIERYPERGISFRRMNRPAEWAPVPVSVTRVGRAAGDLMIFAARLSVSVGEDYRADLLTRLRVAAARHAQDPFAQRVLAEAEARYGDGAAADRLLEPLIAAAPGDAELMYLKGVRYLVAAERGDDWDGNSRRARLWFGRAHQANANHWQTLYRYAQSLRQDPTFLTENTSNVLLLVQQLAPQVSSIRLNAAVQLIARGEGSMAEALLRPLADDPHDAEMAARARTLIEQARRARRSEAPALSPAAPSR